MHKKIHLTGLILVAVSLLITACSSPQATPTIAPTIDANLIYTQAAQTVQAGQSLTEAAKPPTETPTQPAQPTFTMDPNMAAGLTATSDAVLKAGGTLGTATPTLQAGITVPTATLAAGVTPLVLPTATKAVQPPAATGDKCEWVSNSPSDGTQLTKNSVFDAAIKVKNSGTTTWSTKYALRYYAGERMGVPSDYYIQTEVKPNEFYTFQFEMETPSSTGKKEVLIVIQNADGRNMCFINLPYEIID